MAERKGNNQWKPRLCAPDRDPEHERKTVPPLDRMKRSDRENSGRPVEEVTICSDAHVTRRKSSQ